MYACMALQEQSVTLCCQIASECLLLFYTTITRLQMGHCFLKSGPCLASHHGVPRLNKLIGGTQSKLMNGLI